MKLTEAQRRALEAMPFEFNTWGMQVWGGLPQSVRSRSTLEALHAKGFASFTKTGTTNSWYATDAGRAALEPKQ